MKRYTWIDGYVGKYTIAVDGTVRSVERVLECGDKLTGRILKQEVIKNNHTNYRRVTLSDKGKTKRFAVHRLVAIAFIPNPKLKEMVNHIDNNGENNLLSNLEWATHSENMIHAQKQGRLKEAQDKGRDTQSLERRSVLLKKLDSIGIKPLNLEYDGKNRRTHVTFKCSVCGTITRKRSDSTSLTKIVCGRSCSNKKDSDDKSSI